MNTRINEKFNYNYSIMRIICACAVILIHTCTCLTDNYKDYVISDYQYNVLNKLSYFGRFAVPCFFMLTGYLLMKKNITYSYKIVFKKYIIPVVLVLFIFGTVFSMMELVLKDGISLNIISNAIKNVIENKSWAHLWYLYSLIGVYLIVPLIQGIFNDIKDAFITIVIIFVCAYIYPIFSLFNVDIAFNIPINSFPLIYFILGGVISRIDLKKYKNVLNIVSVLAILCTWMLILFSNNYSWFNYNDGIATLFYAISIFMIFTVNEISIKDNKKILYKLDRLCYGVYIIHPFFINIFYKVLKLIPINYSNIYLAVFIFYILFICCSFFAAFLMKKVWLIKKLI